MYLRNKIRAGACLLAVSGLFNSAYAPSMVIAKDAPQILQPSSDWTELEKADRCRLARTFGEGKNLTQLTIDKGGVEPTFNLTLMGRTVRNPRGPFISLKFGPKEETFGRGYAKGKTPAGQAIIALHGASFSRTITNGDGTYAVEELNAERLANIRYLEIERAGLKPFRLAIGAMDKPMDILANCIRSLSGALAVTSTGQSQPPVPLQDPKRWISAADYPPVMLKYELDISIQFRLTVNEKGKPVFCVVEKSTVPQLFDDAVCRALLKRAEFKPALGWDGKPKTSYWRSAARFAFR